MKEKTDCKKHRWIPLLGVYKGKNVPTSLFTCLKCGDLKVGTETIKISQYRLDMGNLPINSVAGIRLEEIPAADPPVSGFTVSMTYGESLTPGDLLCFKSDGKVWKASATGASGLYPVMGLALETASSGSHLVLLHGIYSSTKFNFSSVGGLVYLSLTAGAGTQIQPSDPDNVIQVIGTATNAGRIYFNPSRDYLTHI
jgi:hypothetical protein